MKSNLLFEGLKVIATLILTLITIKFFPDKTKINKEVFAIAILILAYLIYLFIKFLFAIFFPIRVSSSISNNKSPHKLSTHIVYSKKEKIEKEIKLELKIQYKYLSKIVHIFIKWLLKDTDIYLTIETSEKTVFLRGDSYKIIKPCISHITLLFNIFTSLDSFSGLSCCISSNTIFILSVCFHR